MSHIFLSYSHSDMPLMQQVRDYLRAEGFEVWVDENLEAGTPIWTAEIEKTLSTAACLIVILTPASVSSTWVRREILFAQQKNKIIFPLLAAVDEGIVPFELAGTQLTDIRRDFWAGMGKLINSLTRQLGIQLKSERRLVTVSALSNTRRWSKLFSQAEQLQPPTPQQQISSSECLTTADLAFLFNFSQEDLALNRVGRYGKRQKKPKRDEHYVFFTFLLLVFGAAIIAGLTVGNDWPSNTGSEWDWTTSAALVIFAGFGLAMTAYAAHDAWSPPKITKSRGQLSRKPVAISHGRRTVRIGNVRFYVSDSVWRQLKDQYDQTFQAYGYGNNTLELLSM